ncbi:MFS transporter [Streptomyces sp. HU2014]|uniref:MFS transporter n=1 Tax=Streptomyces sp. HU2014 TaxID=2939414 RepID=UPI0024B37E59|nr:MFS transporter [Streptomyces sp. HU2014]
MYSRLLFLTLGTFAVGTDSFVIAGILPEISDSLDVSISTAGLLITVFAFTYAILSPIVAATTAHWPRKRLLLAGLLILAIGNALTAVLPTFGLVLASRAVAGLGAAMFTPTASTTAAALAPPEQRGRALAIVMAGLSGATALGAPIGTVIGSQVNWQATLWFVAVLSVLGAVGIAVQMPDVPSMPPVNLRKRMAPLKDARVGFTLLTTVLVFTGLYTNYSFVAESYDRATDGNGTVLAVLLFVWGAGATVGNLGAGRLTDRIPGKRIIAVAIIVAGIDFALMPLSNRYLGTAIVAIFVWGICGWASLVPLQHRLLTISPAHGTLTIGLNAAATYLAVSASGLTGAAGIRLVGVHNLSLFGLGFIVLGLISSGIASRLIKKGEDAPEEASATAPAMSKS